MPEEETVVTNLGISYWTRNDASDFKRFFHQRVDEKMKKRFGLSWEDIFLALSCKRRSKHISWIENTAVISIYSWTI